jgi:serine/threonine-protein kinase RsbW
VNTTGQIELRLPAEPEFVSVARLALAGVAARLAFDYDSVEDIRIAVAEAVTLLLRCAPNGDGPAATVEVLARWSPEAFEIEVACAGNAGSGFSTDETAVALMEALMDHAEVDASDSGRPTVRLSKARQEL